MRRSASRAGACLLLACAVLPRMALPHAQATTTVQFDREIVHVLNDHCVVCHVENGAAFPLVTYEQTYAARWKIRMAALNRHMPPWAAVAGYGDFVNNNSLTQREIDFLNSWAESFGPRNNGGIYTGLSAGPAAPQAILAELDASRWELGKPDLLVALPRVAGGPASSGAITRVILDAGLHADRWLLGLQYKPSDRRFVRGATFSIQETGQWIGSWTPWYGFVSLPKGLAYKLPARSHILAEIHYANAGGAVADQGSLGLYFARQPSLRTISAVVLTAKSAASTASGAARKLVATLKLEDDSNVLALQPEIRPGVRSVEVTARAPNGARQVLLFARDIPLDWPTPYILKIPVSLRKGTELSVVEYYSGKVTIPEPGIPVTLSVYQGAALPADQRPAQAAAGATQRFKLTGTIKSIDSDSGRLIVQHGDIPGYMGAMTMPYRLGKPDDLKKVKTGDQIRSDVVVNEAGARLEDIEVTGRAK